MLNYNDIQRLFGAPLGSLPKPAMPFELKPWHGVVILVVGYFAYKGIVRSIQERTPRIRVRTENQ
jgi:hypothetical protein